MIQPKTETIRETFTNTILSTLTFMKTFTEKTTYTHLSTKTITATQVTTSTITKHITTTAISTVMVTRSIYPSESMTVMVVDSGSGYKDTRPFTLNETSDLKIIITIYPTSDLKYVSLHWYLVPVGLERYEAIRDGSIEEESGREEFYLTAIPPGNYYVDIISANCKWEIKIEKPGT
ncbi:MAG: hypothetical protein QXL22_05710 [Candidatus Nezhaarchaeales archaeon]